MQTPRLPAFAIEHGAIPALGMVILGTIGVGTWRFDFLHIFNERLGRVVMVLTWLMPQV